MTIGDRIKQRRLELGLSADELGKRINKNRATIYRYESNDIENLPTTVIPSLAKALETTPAYIMGWEIDPNKGTSQDIQERFVDYIIKKSLGELKVSTADETHLARLRGLIMHFERLNLLGQLEAINRVEELTYVNKYIDKKALETSQKYGFYSRNLPLNAANQRTDIEVPEGTDTSDNDIMDAEDF